MGGVYTEFARVDAVLMLQDKRRAEILQVWPTQGDKNGGTRVVVRLRHFARVENKDQVMVRSPQGVVSPVGLEQNGDTTMMELETLPQGNQPHVTNLQLSPFGRVDDISAPHFAFEYLTPAPMINYLAPTHVSLLGGDVVVMSVSGTPTSTSNGGIKVLVNGIEATIHAVVSDDEVTTPGTNILFVTPAQASPGKHIVSLQGLHSEIQGHLIYREAADPATIISSWPKEGSTHGGWAFWFNLTGVETQQIASHNLRVSVDDITCAVSNVRMPMPNALTLRISMPPHSAGTASIKVVVFGPDSVQQRVLAVGSVRYVPAGSLTVTSVHSPAQRPSGEVVSLALKNVWKRTLVSDFSVHVGGVACKPLRLVQQDDDVALLSFAVPASAARGMQHGSIRLSRFKAPETSAEFQVYLQNRKISARTEALHSPTVRLVSTSQGAFDGGTVVNVAIESFVWPTMTTNPTASDLVVMFGDGAAVSKEILEVSEEETELQLLSPSSASASSGSCGTHGCSVSVTISLISDPTMAVSFPFFYQAPGARVVAVQPGRVSQYGGETVTIAVQNLPVLAGPIGIDIIVGGHMADARATTLLSATNEETVLSFVIPSLSAHGELRCHVVPQLYREKTSVFFIHVTPTTAPSIVSIWPSIVMASTPSTIDLIVLHFPVFPLGSFDSEYRDISGPEISSLLVDGVSTPCDLAEITRGGYSINATVQLRFTVTASTAGNLTASLLVSDKRLLDFPLNVVDSGVTQLVKLDPPQGPLIGVVATIHLTAFAYAAASDIAVIVDGQKAQILGVGASSHMTSIVVVMPDASRSGVASVNVLPSSATTAAVGFDFMYTDSCNIASSCGALDLVPRPLSPVDVSLPRDTTKHICDISMCISPDRVEAPRVELLSVSEGAETGGDPVRIIVSGIDGQTPSDRLLVTFGNSVARIASTSYSLSAQHDVVDILAFSPPRPQAGEVSCTVVVAESPIPAATFRFRYHSTKNGVVKTVSPSSCHAGSPTNFTVAVQGWRPIGNDESVQIDQNHTSNVRSLLSAQVVMSDWSITKLSFQWSCPSGNGLETLAVHRPRAYAGPLSLKTISFSVEIKQPLLQVLSMFPSIGPTSGGTLVFLRVANLNLDVESNNLQQISDQLEINFELSTNKGKLQSVSKDSDNVIQMTFLTPAATLAANQLTFTDRDTKFTFTDRGTQSGLLFSQNWTYISDTQKGVEFVTVRSSSLEGGDLVVLSLYGFPALRSRDLVEAECKVLGADGACQEFKKYEDEITVAFGSLNAEVVRVRTSESPPRGRTVVEYRVPATTLAGEVSVLVYRATDAVSEAAQYSHTYTDPPTRLDVSRGSTRGGIIVSVTTFKFNVEKESALSVKFGNTPAVPIRDSLVFESGKTMFDIVVPTATSASVVPVSISSQLSSQQAQVSFEYFEAPEVLSVSPTIGLSTSSTRISLVVARFPVVSSATQISVQIGTGINAVRAHTELLKSEADRTELIVITPLQGLPVSTGSIPVTIVPLHLLTQREREDKKVTFDFFLRHSSSQVVSVSPQTIAHLQQHTLMLRVEGFPIVEAAEEVSVTFGDIRVSVSEIVSSDGESTVLHVKTPRLEARPQAYACSVQFGRAKTAQTSAGFVLRVEDSTLLLVGLTGGDAGPSTGRSSMVIELAGMVRPLALDDVVIQFGESKMASHVKATEIKNDGVVSRVSLIVPPYTGPSYLGKAPVRVRIFVRQEATAAVEFVYTYLTGLKVERATLSPDVTALDLGFDQPSNLSPDLQGTFSKAIGTEGARASASATCFHIFTNHTLAYFGEGCRCYVVSSMHVHVLLGYKASVMPSFTGFLLPRIQSMEKRASGHPSLFKDPLDVSSKDLINFTVTGLRATGTRLIGGITGPSEIGPCESAHFELLSTSLHMPEIVEWNIFTDSSVTAQFTASQSTQMQSLRELVARETSTSIVLHPEDLPVEYVSFTLQVRVVTVTGKSNTWSHHLSKTPWPVPTVKLLSSHFFSALSPIQVHAEAGASKCLNLTSASSTIDRQLQYAWSLTNDNSTHVLPYTGSDILHAPAVPADTVTIGVEVVAASDPIGIGQAFVHLVSLPAPLVAAILGGDRVVSSSEALSLSARASGDRDYPSLVLHYRWRCYNQNSRKCRDTRGSILEFAMTETLLISANTLSPGHDYAFELTVTSADGRFAVAQSHVSVAAEMKSPSAALDLSLVQKAQPLQCGLDFVNIGPRAHLSVSLNGTSPQIVDWSLEWTGYNEGTTDFLGADHAESDQVVPLQVQLGSAISIMDASDLAIPSTYFFNAATEEGRRWCPVTFNLPPSGGACTATATGASDAQMPLEVVCEGFFDEHAPLTYAVGFEVAVAGQEYSLFGKPVFDNKQTVHVLSIPARIHVRITDRLGSFVSTTVVVDGATSQVQQNLDDSLIRDILRAARTEGEVQRSIINVVQNAAATVQTAKHDTLLLNLLSRLLSTVKSSPPSPDIAMRVVQTLLVFFNASLPISGYSDYMNETTELLLTILYPNSLPSGLLSEVDVRQSSALASNIYAQYLQRTNVSSMPWDHAFAVAMEKFGSVMAKKALCNLAPVDPMVEIQEDHFILTLRKVALSSLEGAEMNFPILQDGTTISLVLPAKLPPALSQLTTADVQMVQHRALWTAGGEVLLSYPVSLSVSAAGEADVSHVDFGDQEVHVVLPFNASMLSPNDVQRVYRREGVSCVTWQGDVDQEQPWSSKGCRIETIRVATDETGADVIGLGSVVCACSHMSTFALSWREEAVRFESPTPDTGDLFVLTAGHVLRFHVSALATASAAKKTILLSQLGVQPVPTRSFTNLTLIPAVATSDLQEQADASLTRVNATLSWTPMIAGSYSLSLGLFAGTICCLVNLNLCACPCTRARVPNLYRHVPRG